MNLYLPGIELCFTPVTGINLLPFASKHYTTPLTPTQTHFQCSFTTGRKIPSHSLPKVFSGESFGEIEIPYKWQIFKNPDQTALHIHFFEDSQFLEIYSLIDFENHTIQTTLVPRPGIKTITIDPLFHPLGSMLMVILSQHTNDVIIHASAVNYHNRGYLFTGVSGIGKSTMAKLWENEGAEVINDDRLWLHKENHVWQIFNTPMIYYAQKPAMVPLSGIFLLKQAIENKLTRIFGASAAMRFMANCVQHFFDKNLTGEYLERIMDIAQQIPIYECEFKPDADIVTEVKLLEQTH